MIIGRKAEILKLNGIMMNLHSSFIAFYGRRRVGKTYLIRKYFKENKDVDFFSYTGSQKRTSREEIAKFKKLLKKKGLNSSVSSWFDVFKSLEEFCENSNKEKVVIFLDEIPWLDKKNSNFISELSDFWNEFGILHDNLILVVSGSSGSWMNKMLLKDKGILYNRVHHKFHLKPFSLKETQEFMAHYKKINLDPRELINLYMIYGGIPYYLERYDSNKSFIENLNFDNNFYEEEYDILINSIFGSNQGHDNILKRLIGKKAQNKEFLEKGNLDKKTYNRSLEELVNSDFIYKLHSYKERKIFSYLLVDEFIQNYYNRNLNHTIKGLRFEKIILKNLEDLKKELNINECEVFFDLNYKNTQIDLVLIAEDICFLFEIKYYNSKYTITNDYYTKLLKREENLIDWLKLKRYTKKKIKKCFVSVEGLTQNRNSSDFIDIKISDFL